MVRGFTSSELYWNPWRVVSLMNFSFSRYSDLLCLGLVPLKFELTQSAFKLRREKLYCHDVRENNILSLSRTGNPGAKLYPLNVVKASLLCPVVTKIECRLFYLVVYWKTVPVWRPCIQQLRAVPKSILSYRNNAIKLKCFLCVNNGEAFSSRITQKKNYFSPKSAVCNYRVTDARGRLPSTREVKECHEA